MSALSTLSGNFMTRCPRCAAKMKRVEKHEQAYEKLVSTRGGASYASRTGTTRYVGKTVRVVPVFDICLECGHTVRRKNEQMG